MADEYNNYEAPEIVCAAERNDISEVERLLKAGHNVNAINELNWESPLIIALYKGNTAMANMLLDWGADPKHGGDLENALHVAVRSHNLAIAKRLADNLLVNIDECDGYGYSPLHLAIKGDDAELVKYLLSVGADPTQVVGYESPESDYDYPLHLLRSDNVEIARALVDAGADINQKNSERITPLRHACSHRHPNVALFLITAGADVSHRCRFGVSALDEAKRNYMSSVVDKLSA
jgi:uncharacterized protein